MLELRLILNLKSSCLKFDRSLKFNRAAGMDWAGTWSNSSRLADTLCRADSNLEFETSQGLKLCGLAAAV
jgi:hypothetical protein